MGKTQSIDGSFEPAEVFNFETFVVSRSISPMTSSTSSTSTWVVTGQDRWGDAGLMMWLEVGSDTPFVTEFESLLKMLRSARAMETTELKFPSSWRHRLAEVHLEAHDRSDNLFPLYGSVANATYLRFKIIKALGVSTPVQFLASFYGIGRNTVAKRVRMGAESLLKG